MSTLAMFPGGYHVVRIRYRQWVNERQRRRVGHGERHMYFPMGSELVWFANCLDLEADYPTQLRPGLYRHSAVGQGV
jgi:hypothetical protein